MIIIIIIIIIIIRWYFAVMLVTEPNCPLAVPKLVLCIIIAK